MQIVRIGLDLAKYVFEVHGVDAHGKIVVRRRCVVPQCPRSSPICRLLVGMEASNGRTTGRACLRILATRYG